MLSFHIHSKGQSINLNAANGLIAQHIYCLLADHSGYLWIGTDEGVYRYNGYSLKRYDDKNGLSYKDIWALYEDSYDRLWLYSISDQLGFIDRGKFHIPVNLSGETLYPGPMIEDKGRVSFISSYNAGSRTLCIVAGDSIYSQSLPKDFRNVILTPSYVYAIFRSDSMGRIAYTIKSNGKLLTKEAYRYPVKGIDTVLRSAFRQVFYKYWVFYSPGINQIHILNLPTGKLTAVDVPESVHSVHGYNNYLYVTGDKSIHRFDTLLKNVTLFPISAVTNNGTISGKDITHFIVDSLWGECLATKFQGVYLQPPGEPHVIFYGREFGNYSFLGAGPDDNNYWLDNTSHLLAINNGTHTEALTKVKLQTAGSLIPYNKDSSMIVSIDNIYWLDHRNRELKKILRKSGFKGVILDGKAFVISQTNGFYCFEIAHPANSFRELDAERFHGIEYHEPTRSIWLYTSHKITNFKDGRKSAEISGQQLNDLGVKNIDAIRFDDFGNIYLNADGRLTMFHLASFTVRDLASDIITYNSLVATEGNTLVAAGRYGFVYAVANGVCSISERRVLYNCKGSLYQNAEAIIFTKTGAVIRTDKGFFQVTSGPKVPDDKQVNFRLIASVDDKSRQVNTGDTIKLTGDNPEIMFDLINPVGTGNASYKCRITEKNAGYVQLHNGSLFTHGLIPDRIYHLQMYLEDDIWRSRPVMIYLYVIPDWWQTRSMQLLLLPLIIMSILLAIILAVYFTKRVVTNIHLQRNLFLELKLKAIYAQLNPHFIFNTLSIVQFFANRNEARNAGNVIEKFSRVLRSYLWSSANKMISLKQETEHLKDYIELQQLRFQGKFNYDIVIDEAIDTATTFIPALLFQPLVENAINHGLFHRKKDGLLTIVFKAMPGKNGIVGIIEDNGVGRQQAKQLEQNAPTSKESYGTNLITDLINFFGRYEQLRIEIEYEDRKEPITGTKVTVKIFYTDK